MKLKEAIEVLSNIVGSPIADQNSKTVNATKLGIEALKYIDFCHKNPNCFNISPLPGETKD